jgi:hypothetical protein
VIGSELWVRELLAILPLVSKFTSDIVPRELTEAEEKRLTLESKVVRNRLVNEHLNML